LALEDDDKESYGDGAPDDTLIAWKPSDNPAVLGILHVILALILANGRSIPDRAYLYLKGYLLLQRGTDFSTGAIQRNCVNI
jgi:hypothetical protein